MIPMRCCLSVGAYVASVLARRGLSASHHVLACLASASVRLIWIYALLLTTRNADIANFCLKAWTIYIA